MRFSLFADRLRVTPDVRLLTSDSSLALADALRARPELGAPVDSFNDRPGVRVRIGAAVVSEVSLGDAFAVPAATTDNPAEPLTSATFRRPLAAAASAQLEARITSWGQRTPKSKSVT